MQTKIHLKNNVVKVLKPVHIVTDILFTSKAPKVEATLRGGFETIFIQVELSDNPNDTPFNGVYISLA